MAKVFICYSTLDQAFAHRLTIDLRRNNIDVWIDSIGLKVGDSLIQNIGDALIRTDHVLALLSKNSVNSEWVNRELRVALNREFSERKIVVLPILLDRCTIPPFLLDKVYLDFIDKDIYEISMDKLLQALSPETHSSIFEDVVFEDGSFNPVLAIHDFAEKMGADNLPLEKKQALMIKATEVILKRIFLETIERLDEKGQEEYGRLIDASATQEQIAVFLKTKIPDYDSMVKNIADEFFNEMRSSL